MCTGFTRTMSLNPGYTATWSAVQPVCSWGFFRTLDYRFKNVRIHLRRVQYIFYARMRLAYKSPCVMKVWNGRKPFAAFPLENVSVMRSINPSQYPRTPGLPHCFQLGWHSRDCVYFIPSLGVRRDIESLREFFNRSFAPVRGIRPRVAAAEIF